MRYNFVKGKKCLLFEKEQAVFFAKQKCFFSFVFDATFYICSAYMFIMFSRYCKLYFIFILFYEDVHVIHTYKQFIKYDFFFFLFK